MEEVKEIAECSICTELFTDPRILPCIHTFCLDCLNQISTKTQLKSMDSMPCPLCRTQFVIPKEGMAGLKKNFFMERLVEVAKTSTQREKSAPCEICIEDSEQVTKEVPVATQYCIQCRRNICDQCTRDHRRFQALKDHQLVLLGNPLKEKLNRSFAMQYCEQHSSEQVKLYCFSCKQVICMTCFAKEHKLHECSDIEKFGDKFRQELTSYLIEVEKFSHETSERINEIMKAQRNFLEQVENTEKAIIRRGNELKELVDKYVQSLLDELNSEKQKSTMVFLIKKEENERHKTAVESLELYLNELITKGSSTELCRAQEDMRDRSDSLKKSHVDLIQQEIPSFQVAFEASEWKDFMQADNIVGAIRRGKLETKSKERTEEAHQDPFAKYLKKPEELKTVTISQGVWGLALLNNELFVSSIESVLMIVYNPVTLKHLRNMSLLTSHGPRDIASCAPKNCIFAVVESSIFSLNPNGKILKQWHVPYVPHNLSATSSGNVIVTCNAKILEYDANGKLMWKLDLQTEAFDKSWHSILMDSGNLHLCQGWNDSKYHRVLTVNAAGNVLRTYGKEQGSSNRCLKDPVYLTMDRDGYLLVADSGNHRIVLLNPMLVSSKCLITEEQNIYEPYRILLDEKSGRLYVGTKGGRLHVFKVLQ